MKKSLIILSSPSLFFLIYDLVFYWTWVPTGNYSQDVIYSLAVFSIVNFLNLLWMIYSVNKCPPNVFYGYKIEQSGLSVKNLMILIVIGSGALYLQLNGVLSLEFNEVYAGHASKGIFYIVIIQVVTCTLLFDLFIGRQKPYIFFLVFFFILSTSLLGGRGGVIWASYFIFFILMLRYNFGWIFFITVLISLIIFFLCASILRGTIAIEGGDYTVGFLDFNQIFTLEETLAYTKNSGAQFLAFLLDVMDGFLPRSINPDKNFSTAFTRQVFPEVSELTSYTSGFYANLVFIFGYYALFIVPFFLFVLNRLYLKAICGVGRLNFISLYFLLFPILLVRGGIFESRMVFALVVVLVSISLRDFLSRKIVLGMVYK